MPLPLTPMTRQSAPVDQAILNRERPTRMARPLAYRGKQQVPKSAVEEEAEAEAALAEALRLSLEGAPGAAAQVQDNMDEGGDEDDLLAQAVALSMQQSDAPAAPSPAAPDAKA